MKKAIYPGSFDPVTFGHLDVIERSSRMVDDLIVGVLDNNTKTPLFSVEERVNMLKDATSHLDNVEIVSFSGLLVDFMRDNGIGISIRGLRAVTDFEYELQMAQTNHTISPEMDTVFLTTNLKYAYLSSSIVKEVAKYGGDVSKFVPDRVVDMLYARYGIDRRDNGGNDEQD
jgi:pantetheine-phosphate adenylyltransferase